MNKRAEGLGLTLISVIFFFIIGFASINFIMNEVTNTTSSLQCDSTETISDGNKLLCLVTDTTVIYSILGLMSVILGVITSRLLI